MAGMDDYLVRVLKLAQDDPRYRKLAEYLVSRRAMPEMKMSYLGDTTNGDYTDRYPGNGLMRLNSSAIDAPSSVNTLTHEMTHAVNTQLGKQWYNLHKKPNKTPEEQQFVNNYQKIMAGDISGTEGVNMQAKRFSPEWYAKNRNYRSSFEELPAFAVGDLNKNYSEYDAPAHMDPTIATQYMMLLEQAQKLQSDTYNRSQGR